MHDVIADTSDEATVADLLTKLADMGFDRDGLGIDDQPLDDDMALAVSPLRHGSVLTTTRRARRPQAGWYLVAVAGPDTGAYRMVGTSGITVGRSANCDLPVEDRTLSSQHFTAVVAPDGGVAIEDRGSSNGTVHEGQRIEGDVVAQHGAYLHAGATTFGVVQILAEDLPVEPERGGPVEPFQRRFRDALEPLPRSVKHPAPPSERSDSNRRPLVSFAIPIITAVGMSLITGRYIFLAVIALGPIFFAIDGIRRRKLQEKERIAEQAKYDVARSRFVDQLRLTRLDEQSRDRWGAVPAGLAALLGKIRHERMWERSPNDQDFCAVAIGLHDRPSVVDVEGRPNDDGLPLDTQWSAVLRHSLVLEGPLSVKGPLLRVRALGRSLALDLATAHSPNDVKIWLLTDGDTSEEWNHLRWLPHNQVGESQSRIYATPAMRASAFSQLRTTINQRRDQKDGDRGVALPIHVVLIDCIDVIDSEELTDLLVDGAEVGIIGVVLDTSVTPEGTRAELTLGRYADEAKFVSQSQPQADRVRSFEMTAASFEPAARSMAAKRPAGSSREETGGAQVIRLVDLIDAQVGADQAAAVAERWKRSEPTSRVRVGGLGELITEIDIMRDGPHGLVGGTTRSGKTEFLKSMITSLAVANHPDDLSIVIVDFKGGVDHELSARLPHVIDLSTNHNEASFVRTVRLVDAELQRRQKEFKLVGAPNFDAYQAARRADPSLAPVPRLLLIIDEFSEMLSTETGKENLSSLESVTRVGGGLGVHLLLVTQNFENQLPSQIAANAGLRICFRVQEPAHSKAVLSSIEASTIPKERIGRAFLRSHGGPAVEFQAARVAGPLPGREVSSSAASARVVPFTVASDAPPEAKVSDVPAEDTDMFAIVENIRLAAAATGWSGSAVPWPKELTRELTIGELTTGPSRPVWPIGLTDEPENQRQTVASLEPFGPHALFVGGAGAGLADVIRSVCVLGAVGRRPDELQFYVIDQLGQGLGTLLDLPHVGGVAERNEPLALRIFRHLATEVASRKARLSDHGFANVTELHQASPERFVDLVLVVHGADRLLMHGESQQSPLLAPLVGLVSEAVGTGVRIILTGPPSIAHHRIGSSMTQRFVFECPDASEYGAVGVSRAMSGLIVGPARAVDVGRERLVQIGLVPSTPKASATEVIRAVGQRLTEQFAGPPELLPAQMRELPWPLPIRHVLREQPSIGVEQPVAMSVDTDAGELTWLDAEEDGPSFVITGPARSGRSTALLSAATLMHRLGWETVAVPLSRRSPIAAGPFPGQIMAVEDIKTLVDNKAATVLFLDDVHKWTGDTDVLAEFLDGPGPRAVLSAGPVEFFSGRNDFTRTLPARCALVLAPKGGMDASQFGVRRLSDDVLRDARAGRGILVVAGEVVGAQVPLPS